MKILDHFSQINLTADQHQALENLDAFLESDECVFILQGYAGTGKTTLLKGIAQYLNSERKGFQLMAPTGRAAMILRSKTGMDASTIHRSIYNFNDIEEKQEGTSFKFYFGLNSNQTTTNTIYFVDESSMISDVYSDDEFIRFGSGYLLKDLFQFVLNGENNRKIVFIGDDAQLPPVGMNFSPALDPDYLAEKYRIASKTYRMTEVIRQASESNVLKVATAIRNAIAKEKYNEFNIPINHRDLKECLPENFINQYYETARTVGVKNTVVITHSNRQALEYNEQIRKRRYGDKANQLREQDLLIITHNNYNYLVELFNGMFAKVISVGEVIYTANIRFTLKGGEKTDRTLVFREVQIEVYDILGRPHVIKTTVLDHFLSDPSGNLHPYDQRALYIDFKTRMAENGIKPKSEDYKKAIKSDIYFNAIQAKYGYAITCHKSQGGEWSSVFVDFQVFIGKMSKSYFRWAYTAITRTSKTLLSIDAPSFNAFNQFVVRDVERINRPMAGMYHTSKDEIDVVSQRLEKIQIMAANQSYGLAVRKLNNQLELTFNKESNAAKVQLWYGNQGFTKTTWANFTSIGFKSDINQLLKSSIIPDRIEYSPRFEFQKGLHDYILEILEKNGLKLTNIVQNEWNDQYFILTEADCSVIEFFFKDQHVYTYAKPKSTSGNEDLQLQQIVKELRGI